MNHSLVERLFFALKHNKKSYLSDANEQLINAYVQIRDNPHDVINCFVEFVNTEDEYYRVRDEFIPATLEEAAARFI